MSKELAFENNALEALNSDFIEVQQEKKEDSEYFKLINKIQSKEIVLSYSSLKSFAKTPRDFIKYKLSPKKPQTESQILGSLCDCLLTTPNQFESKFSIVNKTPSTDLQKYVCQDVISGIDFETAFKKYYSKGNYLELEKSLGDYISAIKSKKMVCNNSLLEEAKSIIENLRKSDLVNGLLDSCNLFQNKLEWNYNGYKFIGYTDCQGENLIIDLKFSKDANPDKFERDILNFDYFLQAGMYCNTFEQCPDFYFIVFDRSLNYSVVKLDYSYILYGIEKYNFLMENFKRCVKQNKWGESYNFFDVREKVIGRPRWAKVFEYDI